MDWCALTVWLLRKWTLELKRNIELYVDELNCEDPVYTPLQVGDTPLDMIAHELSADEFAQFLAWEASMLFPEVSVQSAVSPFGVPAEGVLWFELWWVES